MAGAMVVSAASMAGLPAPRAIVCVGPPLSASERRCGSATVAPVQVESPNCRLCPPENVLPDASTQLPPLLLAMIVLFIAMPDAAKYTAPPELPEIVQFVIVTGPAPA